MALEIGEHMKIKILRGTNQIGGCITEITCNETKIIIDFVRAGIGRQMK